MSQLKSLIGSIALTFIITSIRKVDTEWRANFEKAIKTKYPKVYACVFEQGKLIGSLDYWILRLTDDAFEFNASKDFIHFRNLKVDLRDLSGCLRTKEDRVSLYINRDFAVPSAEHLDEFHAFLSQNFRELDAMGTIVRAVGASLSGHNARECYMLCLYGEGSCGKSTLFNLIKAMLDPCYYYVIGADSLSTYDKANRALQAMPKTVRFIFLSEPKADLRMSASAIKLICDGEMTGKKLFKDGNFVMDINAKLFITANHAVLFDDVDSGIDRRVLYYQFKNKFLDNPTQPHEYLRSPVGNKDFVFTDSMKNIMFYYFAKFTPEFYEQTTAPALPISVKRGKGELINWAMFVNTMCVYDVDEEVSLDAVKEACKFVFPLVPLSDKDIVNGIVGACNKLVTFKKATTKAPIRPERFECIRFMTEAEHSAKTAPLEVLEAQVQMLDE